MPSRRLIGAVLVVVVVAIAASFRFHRLSLKPFHHDEGVNHYFIDLFLREGEYHYNPENFHGPLLYELSFLPAYVWGEEPAKLRTIPVLMGTGVVALILSMSPWIGAPGAFVAATFAAISAPDVYFSRTFIHEIYLVFFLTLAYRFLFLAAQKARIRDFLGLAISVVAAFAIKETAAIAVAAGVPAFFAARRWGRPSEGGPDFRRGIEPLGPRKARLVDAAAVAVLCWMIMFSTFGTYPLGLLSFFAAFVPWLKTGVVASGHEKTVWYFFELLGRYYAPMLLLAVPALWDVFRRRSPAAVFLFVHFTASLAVYSAIPYKTPWCVITIAAPLALLAGIGAGRIFAVLGSRWFTSAVFALAIAAGALFYGRWSYAVNFERYDDDTEPIVYVQTLRRFLGMVDAIDRAAARERGWETPILIVDHQSPTKYYLRNYVNRNYEAEGPIETPTEPIIVAHDTKADAVREMLDTEYVEFEYPVWPGTNLTLFIRRDLVDATTSDPVANATLENHDDESD